MATNNYWTRKLKRRRFVQGAGLGTAGVATMALVGCGDDDDDDDGNGGTDPTATSGNGDGSPEASATPSGAPVRGGFNVTQSANVYETVDPHRTIASPVLQILNRVHSKILRFENPDTGVLAADLAEDWETPDAQTVILRIREGVNWHDAGPGARNPAAAAGRALAVDDIVYNIERQKAGLLADGSEGSFGRKAYWNKVDSIEVAGQSITLHLVRPDATFLPGLANEFNLIVQQELIESVEPNATEISADKVIGTGPNILTEWIPGESISALRNPNYFLADQPYLDGSVWIQTFEDPTAYRIAWEQKDVDSFTDPDPDTTLALHGDHEDESYVRYSGTANTVAIYLPRKQAPWNNDNLIRAINIAANRRQLIEQLHNGLGKLSGPVSWLQGAWAIPDEELQQVPGYRVNKEEDIAEARALWEAGGGPDIGEVTWVIPDTWSARAGWGSTPEIIANMFNEAFGTNQFKATTKNYGEIIPAWFSGDFDPFFGWIQNVEIPDARADINAVYNSGSPQNIWGINEPDLVDAKLDECLGLLDLDEANQLLREVQDLSLENGQWGRIIMYNYIAPALYWNYYQTTGPGPEEGWNLLATSKDALENWIDTSDPTFEGRGEPSPKPIG